MATLYNTVSKNGNNITNKKYLTLSDILYIHDTGGYDISSEANISDYNSLPQKNMYAYTFDYNMHYHFLNLQDDIENATEAEVYPLPAGMIDTNLHRMRKTLPYVKNLSEYTNSLFYFNQKYYTPYVIHIGLIPKYPTQATALSSWNPNIYSYKTGSAYTYLPNIMLYTDMYSGLWDSSTDLTHYSPSFNLMGHKKRRVEPFYAYYLGSYFYRYVWKGKYNDDYITDHMGNPTQSTNIYDGSSSGTITCRGLSHIDIGFPNGANHMSHDVNIASAISYIDLVVEFPEEWLDRVLDKIGSGGSQIEFRSWVYAQYHDDNYDYSYTYSYSYTIPEDQGNKCYFRFIRNSNAQGDYNYYTGYKYWVANEWGIYRNSDSSVQTLPDLGDTQIDWGADDSHISILRYFAVFLGKACSYFNNPYSLHNSIDSDLYHNSNKLAIITNNNSYTGLKAYIKALHIHVVNNTSYINNQNSCSIVENQFQYWYARIGGAFKRNIINIYVNNGLINQGTEWGWPTEGAAYAALTPIKIYNGPIIYNGGNYSDLPCGWASESEMEDKFIYDNNGSAPSLHDCTQLEYLQSTGTQYIDTAVIPEKYIHIYIECTPSSTTDRYVCGVRNTSEARTRWAIGNTSKFYAVMGGRIANTDISVDTTKKYFVEIYYNGTNVMFKCGVVGSSSELFTLGTDLGFTPNSVIRIFGSSGYVANYTKWSGKIYCCKIWGGYPNEYPIIDMIPVSYNNGYGMYDRISKRIFYNMGSGSFTPGPQVYESNGTLRIWIDDFPNRTDIAEENGYQRWEDYISDVIYDIENNINTHGANPYEYTGETFGWDGSNYYVWRYNDNLAGYGYTPNDIKYLLTDTIDYTELYERSLANTPNTYGGIVCFLNSDRRDYRIVEYSGFSPDDTGDSIIMVEQLKDGYSIPAPKYDYSKDYLTFTALQDTTFKFTRNALQYSLNNGSTWTTLAANTASPTVTAGNKILWKQTGLTPAAYNGIGTFSATGNFNVSGNIMSLLYGDNFIGQTDLTGKNYALYYLFINNTKLVNTINLVLPATTLSNNCYSRMFAGCTSLKTAPEILPATTLTQYCYQSMFGGCTSLTTAPELPATTLTNGCYDNMFQGCRSLTTAPELPATTLAQYCYSNMFLGCRSLTTAPELPATILSPYCYQNMFYGCTSLTTAPELPATTLTDRCYQSMFCGCKSLTTASELPATILANGCYGSMFYNCTSLIIAPELPATTLVDYCYANMFYNCTSLIIAPELPATTLVDYCYASMFECCTSLTTAPELPATTLVDGCYYQMFYECPSLNYVKIDALYTNADESLYCFITHHIEGGQLYVSADTDLLFNHEFLNMFIDWELYLDNIYYGIISENNYYN